MTDYNPDKVLRTVEMARNIFDAAELPLEAEIMASVRTMVETLIGEHILAEAMGANHAADAAASEAQAAPETRTATVVGIRRTEGQ